MESAIGQITQNISQALWEKYQNALALAPSVMGAILVMLLGLATAELAARLLLSASKKLRLDAFAEKVGLSHFLQDRQSKVSSSHVLAKSLKGYLVFVFFIEATKVAQLTQVSDFLAEAMSYLPNVIVSVLIMLVGLRVGNTMSSLIRTSLGFAQSNTANILGIAAKYTVFTFAVLAALSQLDIAQILVQSLFIGFVAMLTLAGGLAFGLGGKDVVKELLEAIKKVEIREYRQSLKKEEKIN